MKDSKVAKIVSKIVSKILEIDKSRFIVNSGEDYWAVKLRSDYMPTQNILLVEYNKRLEMRSGKDVSRMTITITAHNGVIVRHHIEVDDINYSKFYDYCKSVLDLATIEAFKEFMAL